MMDFIEENINNNFIDDLLEKNGMVLSDYDKFVSDFNSNNQQYSINYNPLIKEFFVNRSRYHNGSLIYSDPSYNFSTLEEIWTKYTDVPAYKRNLINRAYKLLITPKKKKKILKYTTKRISKGRPPKPYLIEATLWVIEHHTLGSNIHPIIKQAFEKHEQENTDESNKTNLKAFGNSVKYRIKNIRDKWKKGQKNSGENNHSFEIFAKRQLKGLLKSSKDWEKKKLIVKK